MATKAQLTAAYSKLQKTLDEQFTEAEQETLEWGTDTETPETYTWHFVFPEDGKKRNYTYNFNHKTVTIRRVD